MKRILILLFVLAQAMPVFADVPFDKYFTDSTLRLDYILCGDASSQAIFLQDMLKTSEWAGRRERLDTLQLRGNGQITVRHKATGEVLYTNGFSSLFLEWQATEEAATRPRAYEICLQVPFPKEPVSVEVTLRDIHAQVSARLTHDVSPDDILIRKVSPGNSMVRTIQEGGSLDEALDLVVLSEGYLEGQEEKFFADAARLVKDALLDTPPYDSFKDRFNIRAVFVASADEGPSVPHEGKWHSTVAGTHYDTFYSERYLTTSSLRKVHDAVGTVPFEHLIVLINTPSYGGGGIYNNVTLASSDHPTSAIVFVHEFGHAFAGLADEYAYDEYEPMYPSDTEPWEPNITTLKDFSAKWADMLPEGTPVPTEPVSTLPEQRIRREWSSLKPELRNALNNKLGVYEGAGNSSKGVYRPTQECRMRINECESFCPVCQRAIIRTIKFYTR